jgi:hypothetical protein
MAKSKKKEPPTPTLNLVEQALEIPVPTPEVKTVIDNGRWPKVGDRGIVIPVGEPDPALATEFKRPINRPNGDWRCNVQAAEIKMFYGPDFRKKYWIGTPCGRSVKDTERLLDSGFVGLYFKPL